MRNSSTSWMVRTLLAAGGHVLLCSKKSRTVSETSPCLQKQNQGVHERYGQRMGVPLGILCASSEDKGQE